MREYFTLHRSVFPSYLTIESGRIESMCGLGENTGKAHMGWGRIRVGHAWR